MSEKEVKITYETLFDILRREKNNEELQQLPEGFFGDTTEYLRDKFALIEESRKKQDSFSIVDKEKTAEDLLSIRKILKELYNRREKKIIKVALDTAMINAPIGNTENMLDYELELFNKSIKLFRQFRVKVLDNLLEGKSPTHLNGNNEEMQEEPKQSQEDKPELDEEQENQKSMIEIVFLQDVPQFVGRELEVYGPFKKDSQETLPEEIANILIEKGRAKKI